MGGSSTLPHCASSGLLAAANTSNTDAVPTNALSPVSKIPPELITSIFSAAIDLELAHIGTRTSPRKPQWIAVLRVCKLWCSIAMDDPHLWSRIFFTDVKLVKIAIRRSKKYPLDIELRGSADAEAVRDWDKCWKLITSQALRIGRLDLEIPDCGHFLETVSDLFAQHELPALETLTLKCSAERHSWQPRELSELRPAHALPRLRTLRLLSEDLGIDPHSEILCSLSVLEIHNCCSWSLSEMSMLISCMKDWTRLQVLVISGSLSLPQLDDYKNEYPVRAPELTVALPHLRWIEIEAAAIFADNFLRHLELASTTSIHLRCYVYGIEGSLVASLTDVVDSLVSSIPGDILQSIHALYIHEDGDRYDDHLVVRGFVDAQLGDLDQLPESEARLSLCLGGEEVPDLSALMDPDETEDLDEIGDHVRTEIHVTACAFLGSISASETFSGIEVLHIDTRNGPEWSRWRSSLHDMNNVKKAILSCGSGNPNDPVEALGEVHSLECVHGGTLFLPKLEELSLKLAGGDDVMESGLLLDVLTTRRDHGVPLRKLRLVAECNGENFTIEDIAESVRSIVEEVIVVPS